MPQLIADRKDIDFTLFEQLGVDRLCDEPLYEAFNKKTIEMIVGEARNFAIKEVLPTLEEGDREAAVFENGEVTVPACFLRAFDLLKEGEWIAMASGETYGGQGMPHVVAQAATDYLMGANYPFYLYGMSVFAAGEMLEAYGTDEQKDIFLKKMYTGQWCGTMDMTEPDAGSDVGNLSTAAVKNQDGTYSITGNKIFITGGDHDMAENIIHMVLARIEGAPAGSKGISLFIVPKIWVNADGSLGEPNDVVCTGIEHKMGMNASATCSMSYGGKGKCRGLLLGEEHQGLKVMFHMMNSARLGIGAVGQTTASVAYLHALNYARERLQGSDLKQFRQADAPRVPIIRHPDVRRMLIWMKAHVEGMRSLVYYGALCQDRQLFGSQEQKVFYKGILDLITPVIKAYCTDRAFEICSEAIQVYGGYGYTQEYPVEQLLRDVRIASIYEGTNGIQAMDLLGRKLGLQNGQVFKNLLAEIQKTTAAAEDIPPLKELSSKLNQALYQFGQTAMELGKTGASADFEIAFAHAVPFQEVMGDILMAWMLLWRATAAVPKLKDFNGDLSDKNHTAKMEKNKKAAFYDGQIRSADYFIRTVLPVTCGKMTSIMEKGRTIVDMPETAFGGF